jgi:CSLREA domain-containing protein
MSSRTVLSLGVALASAALAAASLALIPPPTAMADGETFVVDTSFDDPDNVIGNCVCSTGHYPACTLRAAIQEANACPGAQTIMFSARWYISPTTALPAITGTGTVIDASDQWFTGTYDTPGVWLNSGSGPFSGLVITASNCAVYGLKITGFGQHGVYVYDGAQNSVIGGTGTHRANVISNNDQNGVRIYGATTTGNTVAGNYIGTDSTGRYAEGNGWHGVSVWYGDDNVVTDNLVADNGWSGVTVDAASNVVVQDNHIGMNVLGQPLGNDFYGVHIANGAFPVVSFNDIAFNARGVHIEGGSDPWIYHNTIYSNTATALTPPWGGGIMVTGNGTHGLINYNDILSNTARYGGGIAVANGASPPIHHNTIQGNRAYLPASDVFGGAGIYVHQASAGIEHNRILSNTAVQPPAFPGVFGGGIYLDRVTTSTVLDNEIQGNLIAGGSGGGGGIYVRDGQARILRNRIVGNQAQVSVPSTAGGGVDVTNDSPTSTITIDGNWIAGNVSSGGGVLVGFSSNVSVTNNVIVHNDTAGLGVLTSTVNILAINNTMAHNYGDGIMLEASTLTLLNTIVVSNTGYGLHCKGGWLLIQNRNDVWGNSAGNFPPSIPVYMQQDPRFFDASADRYALRAGSPCVDAGTSQIPDSYNGLSRPQGAGHDIGAYEMAPPVYLPLATRSYP